MAESKSATSLNKINTYSEFSRSVRPLKALANLAGSECGRARRGAKTRRITPDHHNGRGGGLASLPVLAISGGACL
jgi:hypothetical protein